MRPLLVGSALCLLVSTARADDYKCMQAPADMKVTVAFKPETALADLVTWVAGFTCKNIVLAPDVAKYKLTVVAPKPMTPKQALQLFVDAIESTGLVVQQKPDTIIIKMGPGMAKCPTTSAPITVGPAGGELGKNPFEKVPSPIVEATDDEAAIQKLIDKSIKKVSDTQYEISQALIDALTANPMAFMKGARVVPAMTNGKPDGMKLYAIRPSSAFAKLGLANGDTLKTINGLAMTTAENGLEVYQQLRSAKKLEVGLVRSGKPVTLTYVLK